MSGLMKKYIKILIFIYILSIKNHLLSYVINFDVEIFSNLSNFRRTPSFMDLYISIPFCLSLQSIFGVFLIKFIKMSERNKHFKFYYNYLKIHMLKI